MFGPDDDPVVQLRDALSSLADDELAGWSGGALSERVAALVELVERAQAELIRTIGVWDASGAWAEDGAATPTAWLASDTTLARGRATRLVRTARFGRRFPATGTALADGSLPAAHAEVLATLARTREDIYEEHEPVLLAQASTLSVDEFTTALRHWRSLADDVAATDEAGELADRQQLHLSRTAFGSWRIDGELDPEAGAIVARVLDKDDRPDPIGTAARTLSQRRAAALVQLAQQATAGRLPEQRSRPAVDALLSLPLLGPSTGAPALSWDQLRSEILDVGPVASETIRRMLCDCELGRIVLEGDSEVLDVGRRQRTPSRAQRRALAARDGHCQWPGCDRPLHWCDAHHLRPWYDGGATSVDNLVLLCRHHHVLCHEGGWKLTRDVNTGQMTARHRDANGPPRRRRRRRGRSRPPGSDDYTLAA